MSDPFKDVPSMSAATQARNAKYDQLDAEWDKMSDESMDVRSCDVR